MKNFIVVATYEDQKNQAYGGFHDLKEAKQFVKFMNLMWDDDGDIKFEAVEVHSKEEAGWK